MEMFGKRHPWLCQYKCGVNKNGKVQALEMHYYNDGGWTLDATVGSMNMALQTSDNTYYFPNFAVEGKIGGELSLIR